MARPGNYYQGQSWGMIKILIEDGDLPIVTWPGGLIETLFPGRDGVVRVVYVITAACNIRRLLKKLVLFIKGEMHKCKKKGVCARTTSCI